MAASCVPSALIVSSSVVHTIGAAYWTKGGCLTARGIGAPVRPPTVWREHAPMSTDIFGFRLEIVQLGRGDRDRSDPEPDRRRADLATTAVSAAGDVPGAVDVDIGPQLVRKSESITCSEVLDRGRNVGSERVGWRWVVVRHLHAGRDLAHSLQEVRRDPRDGRDAAFDSHGPRMRHRASADERGHPPIVYGLSPPLPSRSHPGQQGRQRQHCRCTHTHHRGPR